MNLEKELKEDIERAQKFEAELNSPVWLYIREKGAQEIDVAVEALKLVDPDDGREIRKLQTIIARNEGLTHWLLDILERGEQAKEFIISHNVIEESQ